MLGFHNPSNLTLENPGTSPHRNQTCDSQKTNLSYRWNLFLKLPPQPSCGLVKTSPPETAIESNIWDGYRITYVLGTRNSYEGNLPQIGMNIKNIWNHQVDPSGKSWDGQTLIWMPRILATLFLAKWRRAKAWRLARRLALAKPPGGYERCSMSHRVGCFIWILIIDGFFLNPYISGKYFNPQQIPLNNCYDFFHCSMSSTGYPSALFFHESICKSLLQVTTEKHLGIRNVWMNMCIYIYI